MKTKVKRIYLSNIGNIEFWKKDNPQYKSLGLSENFRLKKYRTCEKIAIFSRRWYGEWAGFGNYELIARYYK